MLHRQAIAELKKSALREEQDSIERRQMQSSVLRKSSLTPRQERQFLQRQQNDIHYRRVMRERSHELQEEVLRLKSRKNRHFVQIQNQSHAEQLSPAPFTEHKNRKGH